MSFELQASSFALLATLLLAQDPELEAALRADRARIASRKPLAKEEAAAYQAVAAKVSDKRQALRIKVIPVSFTDAAVSRSDLSKSLVEPLAEFYKSQSSGVFQLEPALLEGRSTGGPRSELAGAVSGSPEELKIVGRVLRPEDLESADGFMLIAAGGIGTVKTGLWPHTSTIRLGGKDVDYVLLPEKGDARWFGIAAHEAGHLLKLEDKYGDREAKVGRWCLMGTGYLESTREEPRPGPLCAVCRDGLGWVSPLVHDPATTGLYSLAPGTASVKVPVNKDGKESIVLEARGRSLLVWHTGGGRPIELAAILPTEARDRLTPWSDPPFRTRTLGAKDAWITDVRLQDGKVYFKLGPTADLTPLEQLRRARVGRELGR